MPRKISFSDEGFLCKTVCSDYFSGESNCSDIRKMQRILSKAIITELTYPQRYCLTEYYLHEKKMKDIALELGVNPSTVTRHIARAKKRLKKIAEYY